MVHMEQPATTHPLSERERIAAEVRAAIARADRSKSAIAATIGVHRHTLRSRLAAETPFTIDELVAIAHALDVDPATFLTTVTGATATTRAA